MADSDLSSFFTFAGSLGGPAPAITRSGDPQRPFEVDNNTFADSASAITRSCDLQLFNCFNAAKVVGAGFVSKDCSTQQDQCLASGRAFRSILQSTSTTSQPTTSSPALSVPTTPVLQVTQVNGIRTTLTISGSSVSETGTTAVSSTSSTTTSTSAGTNSSLLGEPKPALPQSTIIALGITIPLLLLTIITLLVIAWRRRRSRTHPFKQLGTPESSRDSRDDSAPQPGVAETYGNSIYEIGGKATPRELSGMGRSTEKDGTSVFEVGAGRQSVKELEATGSIAELMGKRESSVIGVRALRSSKGV